LEDWRFVGVKVWKLGRLDDLYYSQLCPSLLLYLSDMLRALRPQARKHRDAYHRAPNQEINDEAMSSNSKRGIP
jgi:hypothetical protein